ncbi:CinA family protein [Nitratifractor sp.]
MSEGTVSLLTIGEPLRSHPVLAPYLRRHIAAHGLTIDEWHHWEAHDPAIVERFAPLLESGRLPLLIAAAPEAFPLVGRLLCDLTGDRLESGERYPIPAQALEAEEGSYLYEVRGRRVNVLAAEVGDRLPAILLEASRTKVWHLFPDGERLPEGVGEHVRRNPDCTELYETVPGWYTLTVRGEGNIARLEALLAPWRERTIPLPSVVDALIVYLEARGKRITFAESCTGGLVAATLTSRPGASDIFGGSFVTYSNEIKSRWLGVREETLREHGAVSEACVREMAAGAADESGAEIAAAISGIAGPTGAVPGKPVGTVYVCVQNGSRQRVKRLSLHGDRNAIQQATVWHTLKMVIESEGEIFRFFSQES